MVRHSCATPLATMMSMQCRAGSPLPAMPVTVSYFSNGALMSKPTQSSIGSTAASRRG